MRIVFFSHYYPPEVNAPASRTSEHCREWVRMGHDVTVITSAPNHPRGELYPGYQNRLFQTEVLDGVKVVRVWTYLAANEGFLRRTLNYVSYMLTAALAVPRISRPDVYVSTSPQFFCGLAGMIAAKMRHRPWLLEIRDLWPESIITVGAMRKSMAIRLLEWFEGVGYRNADRIVALTDSFVPHIAAHCEGEAKIDVIKNGVDLSLFKRGSDADAVKRELGLEGRFIAAYVGTHGMAHGLDTLLEAAAALKHDSQIAFLLVGDGAEQARLAARVASERLENVRILGQLPKERMPGIWAATDASLILLRRSDTFRKVLPSKMFEAMAMEVPIVLGVEGEAKALLESAGAGIAITPENADQLAAAVSRLRDDASLARSYGRKGAAFVREHFDRSRLARRYFDVLDAVVSGKSRASAAGRATTSPRNGDASSLMNASRLIEFARHIPMRKLARRIELDVRRRIGDRLGRQPARLQSHPKLAVTPPAPIFAPRRSVMNAERDRLIFTFLNRTVAMSTGSIDWNAPGDGAANQLWRMNLHYMEYLEDADDEIWAQLATEWLAANGMPSPGAWRDSWNSYSLSIRVVVWLQELVRRTGRIDAGLADRLEASASEQIRFLLRNLETDIGGNHLVKNIKALIWASCYFTGAEAERWRQRGIDLLRHALEEQILPDGVHYERSPSYHAQVFADLLECRHALGRDPLEGRLDSALAGMAQAIADLAHPDGRPALFSDAGLSMAYAPAECLDAYARISGLVILPRGTFAFPDAGYFGLRRSSAYLVADCGRIAPDDLPAHGHGDILSFEWSIKGRRIIVDQGVFEYVAGERRARSRASTSHNTFSLDGADQAQFFGAFRCGRRPNVTVRRYEAAADRFVLEGSHDGFASLGGRPIHVRRFEASDDGLVIHDGIEGSTDRAAAISFLLHPECRVETSGQSALILHGDARAKLHCEAPLRAEPAVWWPDMGVEMATNRLKVELPPGATAHVSRLEVAA